MKTFLTFHFLYFRKFGYGHVLDKGVCQGFASSRGICLVKIWVETFEFIHNYFWIRCQRLILSNNLSDCTFFTLERANFKTYLLLFSPCAYHLALECIIAPCAIYSYWRSYSVFKISSLLTFSREESRSLCTWKIFNYFSKSAILAFLSLALRNCILSDFILNKVPKQSRIVNIFEFFDPNLISTVN